MDTKNDNFDGQGRSLEEARMRHTLFIAVAGLVAMLSALLMTFVALNEPEASKQVPVVLAPVLALIGTLVGAVAGHSAGSTGTEAARSEAASLREQVRAYERAVPPELAHKVRNDNKGIF